MWRITRSLNSRHPSTRIRTSVISAPWVHPSPEGSCPLPRLIPPRNSRWKTASPGQKAPSTRPRFTPCHPALFPRTPSRSVPNFPMGNPSAQLSTPRSGWIGLQPLQVGPSTCPAIPTPRATTSSTSRFRRLPVNPSPELPVRRSFPRPPSTSSASAGISLSSRRRTAANP